MPFSYALEKDYPQQTTLRSLRILYIEDEETIRNTIVKVLRYFSSNILSFSTAEEAKTQYLEFAPDIVICDINLPGMSGIDFVKWIRSLDDQSQIFLLTAYTDKGYLLEAVKLSLVDYLIKPIDFLVLEKTLKLAALRAIQSKTLTFCLKSGAIYYYQQRTIFYRNALYTLTAKEATLLDVLVKNKNRMSSKEEIKALLWEDEMASESAFKSLMNKLRSKIGKESIENISGVGYRVLLDHLPIE